MACAVPRVAESVAGGPGLDDGAALGEAVDDRSAQARVGEGLGPPAERLVAGDRDAVLLLELGHNLEEELGATGVQAHVAELVDDE